jgi:hypothetical protein
MTVSIKERVAGKVVKFSHYQHGELWYVCEDGFTFPVPLTDTGDGAFKAEDKAMYFMRWIRKHMDMIELAKTDVAE